MNGHKVKIRESFSRSALEYDQHAFVQSSMMQKLMEGLKGNFKSMLDLGSGTGSLAYALSIKYPEAKMMGIDIAPGMVEYSRAKYSQAQIEFVQGDAENIQYKKNAFDLVVSNASLQWMDSEKVFNEVSRVLCPKGEFHFTTFGPQTLCELKTAGLSINQFPARQKIEDQLIKLFSNVRITSDRVKQGHRDIYAFFMHLKKIGAQNPRTIKNRGLMTPKKLAYHFPLEEGLEITYEIYYVKCQK